MLGITEIMRRPKTDYIRYLLVVYSGDAHFFDIVQCASGVTTSRLLNQVIGRIQKNFGPMKQTRAVVKRGHEDMSFQILNQTQNICPIFVH